jgi:hypothetical protein
MFHLANQTRQSVAESFGKIPALAQQTRVSLGQCGEILGEVYFPTEGDDAISKMSGATGICCTAPILTWRGDPRETHSDWKIVVVTSETDSRTYHVHKSVLSTGPRSCEYFSKLFLEKNKPKKNKSQTTRIELDEQDADSFPLLLDFIYGTGQQRESNDDDASLVVGNDFTANEAVSLRHLAQLFDCEGLMLAVNKFIQRDLSLKTGPVYLVQAYSYQDKRLLEGAKLLCVENFLLLETGAVLRFPLQLFRSIVYSVAERSSASADDNSADDQTILSYHLSDVVCQYFEKHPKVLTVKILLGLTDEKIMPDIAPEAAIGFTALARELDSGDIAPESPEWIGLTILCERCAKAVVREYGWQDFNVASALHEFLDGSCSHEKGSKIDSLLFATSLASALDKAQRDSTPMNKCSSDSKRQLQNENTELRETNRGMRKEIEKYEDKLADTKEELRILKKQMKELKKRTR